MTTNLTGKTALVTGGGTGIGATTAIALAEAGCRVAISGRREEKLREVAGDRGMLICPLDVGDRGAVDRTVEEVTRELGRIDIIVCAAGINVRNRAMAELYPADWDRLMRINATGVYTCRHAVLPQMRERRDGLIVTISSVAGKRAGLLGGVAYNASKFAMSALGLTVAQEEKDRGVRVTTIYPGEVDTPILDERPVLVTAEHRARILQPEDVAASVLFVASLPPRAHVPELVITPTTQAYF